MLKKHNSATFPTHLFPLNLSWQKGTHTQKNPTKINKLNLWLQAQDM